MTHVIKEFGRLCSLADHLISKEVSEYQLDRQHLQYNNRRAWRECGARLVEPTDESLMGRFCGLRTSFSWPSICEIFLSTCRAHDYIFYKIQAGLKPTAQEASAALTLLLWLLNHQV